MIMEISLFWTIVGSAAGAAGLMYMFLRNFKTDVRDQIIKLDQKIDKLDEKLTHGMTVLLIDVDRRLCRMEDAFSSKECCRIQDERQLKKAE